MKKFLIAAGVLLALALASLQATFWYITDGYRRNLRDRARDRQVQNALRSWVSTNWVGRAVSARDLVYGDGVGPGVRWLQAPFDGTVLGMGEHAHVRLLGPSPSDLLGPELAPEAVTAISFTERSRYAVAVQVPHGQPTTLESVGSFTTTAVAPDIWVICDG